MPCPACSCVAAAARPEACPCSRRSTGPSPSCPDRLPSCPRVLAPGQSQGHRGPRRIRVPFRPARHAFVRWPRCRPGMPRACLEWPRAAGACCALAAPDCASGRFIRSCLPSGRAWSPPRSPGIGHQPPFHGGGCDPLRPAAMVRVASRAGRGWNAAVRVEGNRGMPRAARQPGQSFMPLPARICGIHFSARATRVLACLALEI